MICQCQDLDCQAHSDSQTCYRSAKEIIYKLSSATEIHLCAPCANDAVRTAEYCTKEEWEENHRGIGEDKN